MSVDFIETEAYAALLPKLTEAEKIIKKKLLDEISSAGIPTLEITHRIKDAASAVEKIKRKPDNYSCISDLTDLIGFRIICYFSDDVDKIASLVEELFVIDRENSVDKRQVINPTAFGYLSLHYICSLPESEDYPKELCGIKFEIQMRSSLQHTWAEIEHDLGYKSVYAIPREVRREFSRIAGLLELADESFVRIRNKLNDYTKKITEDIKKGNVSGVMIDSVTLSAYLKYNEKMQKLTKDIAAIQNASVIEQIPESILPKLEVLGITELGELESLAEREREHALELAEKLFEITELDEIASTAGLHFLCRAELIYGGHTDEEIYEFFAAGADNPERVRKQAAVVIKNRKDDKNEA